MIDKSKSYRTRDGREVRIYATDGGGPYPVHGAYKTRGEWYGSYWTASGRFDQSSGCVDTGTDLIEVRPRIKREVWVNVYRQDDGYEFATYHDNATDAKSESGDAIIARAHLILDVEEGEGL